MSGQATKISGGGVARLSVLLDRAGISGRGRRSSLFRWLKAHHHAFATMLADKEPSWDEVATGLAAMGLRDGQGKPPNAERARKAWWAVRRAKSENASKRQARLASPALMPGEIAPAVQAVTPASLAGAEPRPRMRLDIRPATPHAGTAGGPAVSAPVPAFVFAIPDKMTASEPQQPDDQAAEQVRQLLVQMQGSRVPLPKIVP